MAYLGSSRINKVLRGLQIGGAVLIVCYCAVIFTMVATTPDLRLRVLLSDNDHDNIRTDPPGVVIRETPQIQVHGPQPHAGDILVRIAGWPIGHFSDFSRAILKLRSLTIPPGGGGLPTGTDPLEHDLPRIVEWEDGSRAVEVVYRHPGETTLLRTYVILQSIPAWEILLSLIWFICQLAIFSVGALAFWRRSFDRHASLFLGMCTATLGAFVAGFHWWLVCGSYWLTIPFVASSLVVPVVTLHFFLEFPHAKAWVARWRGWAWLLYIPAAIAFVGFLLAHTGLWIAIAWGPETIRVEASLALLRWLRAGTYAYVVLAALYFVGTMSALIHSVATTKNPVERSQIGPIVAAAFVASVCIAYTLGLAVISREAFALGGGRIPMFLASLVFMFAYAVGMARYKLMLIDQLITRGMWYSFASSGATLTVSLLIAATALSTTFWRQQLTDLQAGVLATLFVLIVVVLIFLRDQWQRWVDRRFFREKYRLDRALQRMNEAVGRLSEPNFLSDRMLASCCEAMQAEWAAVYGRSGRTNEFRLMSAQAVSSSQPMQFQAPGEFLKALATDSMLHLVSPGKRDDLTPTQEALRLLRADLVHSMELDGELVGVVVLGPKRGEQLYSAEDLTFLTALGQMTAVALRYARVHQDIAQLNEDLRRKADRIAQQQQQIAVLQAEVMANRGEIKPAAAHDELRRDAILGSSPSLMSVLDTVRKVAASETSVLIRGESGTGKELLARAIHESSPRRSGPLISVHCAALAEGILESELFGHVKGAFTGAQTDRRGRFELAEGGTLFLDEVGDIPLETQVKLLRVLQERSFEPVGSGQTRRVDVRVITATHRNLEELIREGRFREDLYYRLNVVSLTLPPLRERPEDILELAMHFLKRGAQRNARPMPQLDDDVVYALRSYGWPGNVRELENALERALVLSDGILIRLEDLPPLVRQVTTRKGGATGKPALNSTSDIQPLAKYLPLRDNASLEAEDERNQLRDALQASGGNKARAARLLGLPRSTFFSKLKKHSLD